MKIVMLAFSQTGWQTGQRLLEPFHAAGHVCRLYGKSKYIPQSIAVSHAEWTKEQFQGDEKADAIIYIGACGIAVRSIAPFLKSKKTDPAVLVVDECGKYVISLLSGHLGGANELAKEAAEILHAEPVITTATDLHGRFAVDTFAKKNHCAIFPMETAKEVSAALLSGEKIGFYSDFPWEGNLPEGLVLYQEADPKPEIGIVVSIRKDCKPFQKNVFLVPQIVSIGMGCRKGKEAEDILRAAEQCLMENGIYQASLEKIASIDLKKEETGLIKLAEKWKLPFIVFTKEELKKAKGTFTASSFVSAVTGVDNVCERSAVLASIQGELIQKKMSGQGVTAALAVREWRSSFE